jgi:adenosylmethionine-8-amino-7-oxononanoate aminotransferase
MLLQPEGFLNKLRKVCDENKVLLIVDEVATGFGRTGKMFACEHEGITPDIMCVAKGVTGGYLPLAATLTTKEVYDGFKADYKDLKTFFHGHTYTGNPLAAASAIANIELFEKEKTIESLKDKIDLLTRELKRINDLEHVFEIRQLGLMIGIELMQDAKNLIPYNWEEKIGIKVILKAREKGLIIRPLGPVIVLMPPLSITKEEIKWLVDVVYESIDEITGNRV